MVDLAQHESVLIRRARDILRPRGRGVPTRRDFS